MIKKIFSLALIVSVLFACVEQKPDQQEAEPEKQSKEDIKVQQAPEKTEIEISQEERAELSERELMAVGTWVIDTMHTDSMAPGSEAAFKQLFEQAKATSLYTFFPDKTYTIDFVNNLGQRQDAGEWYIHKDFDSLYLIRRGEKKPAGLVELSHDRFAFRMEGLVKGKYSTMFLVRE